MTQNLAKDVEKQLDEAFQTEVIDEDVYNRAKEVWGKLWSKWPIKPVMVFRSGTFSAVRWDAQTDTKYLSLEIQKEGYFINMTLYSLVKTVSMRNKAHCSVKDLTERMEYLLKVFAVEDSNAEYG